jgi:hypothetical protein
MKKIELQIETQSAVSSINALEKELNQVREQLNNLDDDNKDTSRSTEDLGNKYADLTSKLQQYERQTENVSRAITTQSTATTQLNANNQQLTDNLQKVSERALKAAQSFSRMIEGTKTLASSFSDGSSSFKAFENVAGSTSKVLADISSKNYLGAIVSLVSAWRDWGQVLGFSSEELNKFAMYVRAVGTVIGKALISPIKSLISLFRGDFKQALEDIKNGFKFTENWNQSIYNEKIKQAWKNLGDDGVEAWERIKDAVDQYAGATLDRVIERTSKLSKTLQDQLKMASDAAKEEKKLHQEKLDQLNERIAKEVEVQKTTEASIISQKKGIEDTKAALQKANEDWTKATESFDKANIFGQVFGSAGRELSKAKKEVDSLSDSLKQQENGLSSLERVLDKSKTKYQELTEEANSLGQRQEELDRIIKEAEEDASRVVQAEEEKIRKAKEETVGTAEYAAAQERKSQEERIIAADEAYQELQRIQEEWRRNSLDSFDRQKEDLEKKKNELINTLKSSGSEKDLAIIPDIENSFKEQIDKVEQARQEFLQKQEEQANAEAEREEQIRQAALDSQKAAEQRLAEERARIWKEFTTRNLSEKDRELQQITDLEKKYLDNLDKTAKDYESRRAQITSWGVQQRQSIEEKYKAQETNALNSLAEEWNNVYQQISDSRLSQEEQAIAQIDRQEQEWLSKYGDYEGARTEITQYAEEQRQKIREEFAEKTDKIVEKQNKETLRDITDLAAGASGALQTLTAGFSLLGVEMGDDIKVIKTLQSLMAMTSGFVAVEKGVIAFKKLGEAIKLSTVYTKAATIATTNFSKALIATGVGALVVALGALLAILPDIIKRMTKVSQEVKNLRTETDQAIKANDGWDEVIDFQVRLRKAYGDTTAQIRVLKAELLSQKLDDAYEAYEKALSNYSKKVEEMGNTSSWAFAKMSRLKKECKELSDAVKDAGDQVSKVQDQIWKNTLDNIVDEVSERRARIQKSITTERTLLDARLKLDISYFEHLRQLINTNYTIWQEQQARTWDPNRTKIGEYEEELRKITKVLKTYQDQMKAVDDSRDKRRKSLENELNQRLRNQEITKKQLEQELEEFDSQERATMDSLKGQIAQLKLSWSSVNEELRKYRHEIELNSKISKDNIDNTLENLETELEYLEKRREYMKPDPSWYEPVSGWWNESDQENIELEHEQAQLELQNQIYQQELENLQYQLDNKLIAYQDYLEKKTELESQITLNEEEQADVRIKIAKNEADKKKLVNNLYYKFLQEISGSISSILGSVADTMEEGTKEWKALKYAQVIIDTLAGSIAAFVSNLSAFPAPYNLIAGGLAAASVIATGIATANQIANTEVSKNATPSSNASVSYLTTNISNVRQTTTASDYQELRDNDMAPSDIRVVVYESDITDAQNAVRANVEQNTY